MIPIPVAPVKRLPRWLVALIALGGFFTIVLSIYIGFSLNYQTIHALGPSMAPTIKNNDFLLLSRTAYLTGSPRRGDIVVFRTRNGPAGYYIKRVVAIPGDRLRIQDAQVYINGSQLHENYLSEPWHWSSTWNGGSEEGVPADCYFCFGRQPQPLDRLTRPGLSMPTKFSGQGDLSSLARGHPQAVVRSARSSRDLIVMPQLILIDDTQMRLPSAHSAFPAPVVPETDLVHLETDYRHPDLGKGCDCYANVAKITAQIRELPQAAIGPLVDR